MYVWHRGARWTWRIWMRLAWLLPGSLVYWAAIRLAAHATTGKYADQVVPELSFMDALERWESHA